MPCAADGVAPAKAFPRQLSQPARLGHAGELLERLALDLPDALAGDVEHPAQLVEGPRLLPAEPVAQLQHPGLRRLPAAEPEAKPEPPPLAVGQLVEQVAERLLPQRGSRRLLRS